MCTHTHVYIKILVLVCKIIDSKRLHLLNPSLDSMSKHLNKRDYSLAGNLTVPGLGQYLWSPLTVPRRGRVLLPIPLGHVELTVQWTEWWKCRSERLHGRRGP